MSFYAKEIEFCADDECGAYVALIAIAKKKGGNPIKFVLYRFLSVSLKGRFLRAEIACIKRQISEKKAVGKEVEVPEHEVEIMEAKESGIIAEMTYVRDKKFAHATV